MNSTYKVVFNKARGALMVVNEVTSSVQNSDCRRYCDIVRWNHVEQPGHGW